MPIVSLGTSAAPSRWRKWKLWVSAVEPPETTYKQQVLTNLSNFSSTQTQQQLQYPPAPAIDHIKEQEFWNHVVERTEQ